MGTSQRPSRHVRLLLIDDDAEFRALMAETLSMHDYDVVTAGDGLAGLEAAHATHPDVVVLDVMMPRLDGFDVLRRLRRESQVPVVMLTARTAPQDRVQGLNIGADDYLAKPFTVEELLARLNAVLRRSRSDVAQAVTIGMLRVDRASRRAWIGDVEVPLTGMEFDILGQLIESPGTIVSRDSMARSLYGRDATAIERTTDVHISHLRKKLARADGIAIKTVRGVGYVLVRDD